VAGLGAHWHAVAIGLYWRQTEGREFSSQQVGSVEDEPSLSVSIKDLTDRTVYSVGQSLGIHSLIAQQAIARVVVDLEKGGMKGGCSTEIQKVIYHRSPILSILSNR
jgi:hypothetical protein